MLHIVNLEEIQAMLLRVPGLIHALDRRDPEFLRDVKTWLTQAEQILVSNRLAVAADIAALRGVLISAERGVVPPGLVFNGRVTARKIRDAAAADILRKAEEILSSAIRADAAQFVEAERLARQIVSIAQRKGLIRSLPTGNKHTETLNAYWQAMLADPELGPATTHLAGLIGIHDAWILIDRLLPMQA
jgi:hypothetical protein